jgi:hypothetical protein
MNSPYGVSVTTTSTATTKSVLEFTARNVAPQGCAVQVKIRATVIIRRMEHDNTEFAIIDCDSETRL